MRFATILGATVFFGSLSSAAQTGYPAQSVPGFRPEGAITACMEGAPVTVCKPPLVPACPIDMHVRQGVGGGMLAVDQNGQRQKIFAPRLRLFLNDLRPDKSGQRIVSATVQVHGANGKGSLRPIDSAAGDPSKMEKTVTVRLAEWGEPGVSGDFRLPGFVTTSSVDLQTVTYQDGSTWKLAGIETCRVAPDLLVRVGD